MLAGNVVMTSRDVENDTWLSDQQKMSAFAIGVPIYIAVEGKLNDTWSARGGVNKMLFTSVSMSEQIIDDADEETLLDDAVESMGGMDLLNLTGGITGTFGAFSLDMVIDYDVALDGPYFLSGSNNGLSFMVGGKYAWK